MTGRALRRRGIAAALAVLVVGGLAVLTAPDDDGVNGPIPVRGAVGHAVEGRLASITVEGSRSARAVRLPDGTRYGQPTPVVASKGMWAVIDASVTMSTQRRSWTAIELRADGVRYRVDSALPGTSLAEAAYRPGIASRGSFVFEVPRDLAGRRVELWLTPDIETHDDTVPVIALTLDSTIRDRVTVEAPTLEGAG